MIHTYVDMCILLLYLKHNIVYVYYDLCAANIVNWQNGVVIVFIFETYGIFFEHQLRFFFFF